MPTSRNRQQFLPQPGATIAMLLLPPCQPQEWDTCQGIPLAFSCVPAISVLQASGKANTPLWTNADYCSYWHKSLCHYHWYKHGSPVTSWSMAFRKPSAFIELTDLFLPWSRLTIGSDIANLISVSKSMFRLQQPAFNLKPFMILLLLSFPGPSSYNKVLTVLKCPCGLTHLRNLACAVLYTESFLFFLFILFGSLTAIVYYVLV